MVGPSTVVGRQMQAGVGAAVELAGQGSVLGRPIVVVVQDDGCNREQAGAVAQKLANVHPAVVIGHTCSEATLAAAPVYAAAGVLEITAASTNPAITEGGIGTLFRLIGRDDQQGILAARFIVGHAAGKRVAVLRQRSPYSQVLTAVADAELRRLGHPPALTIDFAAESSDYLAIIDRLRAEHIDLVYLVGGLLDCALLVREAHQLGVPLSIVAGDTVVSSRFWDTAGEGAEGTVFTFSPDIDENPANTAAFEAIRRRGGEIGYGVRAYAATQVWLAGVTRAGSFDAAAVAAAIRQAPVETVLGPVSFDAKGDMQTTAPSFVLYEWRHGQRVKLDR
jgi:branched-chain amino acid transport system substrate-binding protein